MAKIIRLNRKTDEIKEIELNPNYEEISLLNGLAVYLFVFEHGFSSFGSWCQALSGGFDKMREMEEFRNIISKIYRSGGNYIYCNEEYSWTIEK